MATTLATMLANAGINLANRVPEINEVTLHTTGQITFANELGSITEGSRFSCGLQTFRVWSANLATLTVQVQVVQGSTSALLPSGSLVEVLPRCTPWELMVGANDTLRSLTAKGIFNVKAGQFLYDAAREGYDLTGETDIQDIYEVLIQNPGPFKSWPRLQKRYYRLERSAATSDFPSGQSLTIWQPGQQGYPVRVVYFAQFGQFSALTDTPATVGASENLVDLISMGAVIRAMVGAEIGRNDPSFQPDTRRAAETPPGAIANSLNGLKVQYQQRLSEEQGRFLQMFPPYYED